MVPPAAAVAPASVAMSWIVPPRDADVAAVVSVGLALATVLVSAGSGQLVVAGSLPASPE